MLHAARGIFAATVAAAVLTSPAMAEDWPQWRGIQRDGVWHETGIIDGFGSDRLES
jgi:hypothetical protein